MSHLKIRLSPAVCRVALALSASGDYVDPHVMAKQLGLHPKTVIRALERLSTLGAITAAPGLPGPRRGPGRELVVHRSSWVWAAITEEAVR